MKKPNLESLASMSTGRNASNRKGITNAICSPFESMKTANLYQAAIVEALQAEAEETAKKGR